MTVVALTAVLAVVAGLARATFRRARRRHRPRLSAALAAELRIHKLACLHEPAERVELELAVLLGDGPASEAAVSHLLRALRHLVTRYGRSATRTRRVAPQS